MGTIIATGATLAAVQANISRWVPLYPVISDASVASSASVLAQNISTSRTVEANLQSYVSRYNFVPTDVNILRSLVFHAKSRRQHGAAVAGLQPVRPLPRQRPGLPPQVPSAPACPT